MSKHEIIIELPKLSRDDLLEVQARLDELIGETWLDDELTDEDVRRLGEGLSEYRQRRDQARSWDEVEAELRNRTR